MKTNRKLILVLLICGLILSSLVRIVFNLSNGFEYHNFWIKILPLPIIDFAGKSSNQMSLTSTIIGYIIYLIAGFLMIQTQKNDILWISIFVLIILISIYFETTSMIQDLNSRFTGQHLRTGPILFILGLLIFLKDKKKQQEITNPFLIQD
jgi:hypothetical protein